MSINFSKHRCMMEGSFYKVVRLDLLLRAEKRGEKRAGRFILFFRIFTPTEKGDHELFLSIGRN